MTKALKSKGIVVLHPKPTQKEQNVILIEQKEETVQEDYWKIVASCDENNGHRLQGTRWFKGRSYENTLITTQHQQKKHN